MKFELNHPLLLHMLVLSPFLISIITTVLMLATFHQTRLQKTLHILGLILLLASSIASIILLQITPIWIITFGGWSPPFGISFGIDSLSVLMILLISIISFATGLYALTDIDTAQFKLGFLPAFWFLNIGMLGSVMTGDLFNLYVWFEMMLISSFILMGLGKPKEWLFNKFKYVVLNLIGTMLFLTAIAFVYGMAGTLNLADLAAYFSHTAQTGLALMVMLFLLLGLAVKSALFPVFSWLPASYHTTSATASAIMGGLLSKIGVYVMIRLFTLVYPLSHAPVLRDILLLLAALTMVVGVLGAAAQFNYRRILSFHIVSQIGYMIFGLALNTPLALAATLFFIAHNILAKTSLFLTGGVAQHITKASDIRKMGGLYRQAPSLAILFLISALALAGMPPLTGFWAKFLLIQASFSSHIIVIAIIALGVSILTLYSMLKIWNYAYLSASEQSNPYAVRKIQYLGLVIPIGFLVALILLFSLLPQPVYHYCEAAAQELLNPQLYIQTTLGAVS